MTTVASHQPVRSAEPEVRTTAGVVCGRREDGLAVFRGIPFAAPPVGQARFAAPQPVPPWQGVREAVAFGPPPPQQASSFAPQQQASGQDRDPSAGSRDQPAGDGWLTVNLWTPDPDPAARRPVMVWIYGGAYGHGFCGSYDARRIAGDGDLVVVTLNYREGIEGFAAIQGAPANRGLLDQVAALTWVHENIAGFGGDPDRVTIFGESAGAGSVAALLAMPTAAGLFRRAITQSMDGVFFADDLGRDIAGAIAAQVGLRPTVADLSGVDPRQLPAAGEALAAKMGQYEDRWGPVAHTISLFAPVVDGEVLPSAPWQALAAGAGRGVALIVGHNRDEYRLFMALAGQLGKVSDVQATEALRVFAPGPDGERAYRRAYPDVTAERLCELVQTDWRYRMPVLHLVDAQVAGGGQVHVYELTWPAPGGGGILGACHGLDVPLLFGSFDTDLGRRFLGPEPPAEAKALGDRFRSAWTGFAATGDPGWPAYDPQRRLVQVFDTDPQVTPTRRRPPGASGSAIGSRRSRCSPLRRRAAARRTLHDSLGGL